MSQLDERTRSPRRAALSLLAVLGTALTLGFPLLWNTLASDRESGLQLAREERARMTLFATKVLERRAAAAEANASLKRGFNFDEIVSRKREYYRAYIESQPLMFQGQQVIRTTAARFDVDDATRKKYFADTSSGAFVDRRLDYLRVMLSGMDGIVQKQYDCWILQQSKAGGNRSGEEQTPLVAPASVRLVDAKIADLGCAGEIAPPPASDAAATAVAKAAAPDRFQSLSRGVQLCINQLTVEVHRLHSERGRSMVNALRQGRLTSPSADTGRFYCNVDRYCLDPSAPDFAEKVRYRQSGVSSDLACS